MTIDDVSHTLELSGGGGGAQLVHSGVSTVWTEETLAGDTPGRECPHDDMEIRPRIGTMRTSEDRVPSMNIESPYGGGVPSLPGDTGSRGSFQLRLHCLPMDPCWVLGRLQSCGSTRPLRGMLPDGSVPMLNRIGPVGLCEMSSLSFEEIQEPLEHSVLIYADPAGQHAAVGTLFPSDCYPAGPAGPCVAGGPVGPDDSFQVLEPFEQLVLDHADPAGQHAVIQDTVDSLEHPRKLPDATLDGRLMEGTTYLEHSALGVSLDSGLMEGMLNPQPVEQSVLNTLWVAQPNGGITEETSDWEQVAHPVPGATLDGRLMEGTTYPEHSVLGVFLDSGLMEGTSSPEPLEQSVLNTLPAARPEEGATKEISDWQPEAYPVPKITLDGRLMEGTTYLEHSVLGVSLDSGLMEGTLSPEPLEQSVLNTLLVTRPTEGSTETKPPERSALVLRLWTFELGITGASDGGRCPGSSTHEGVSCPTSGGVSGPRDSPKQ